MKTNDCIVVCVGALQSYGTLKAHTLRLEQELAGRQATAAESTGQSGELLRQRERQVEELRAAQLEAEQEAEQLSQRASEAAKQVHSCVRVLGVSQASDIVLLTLF